MAREITQRISLEGGEAILKALQDLGRAGEEAFKAISDAAKKADALRPLERFSQTAEILRERLRNLGEAGRRVGNDFRAFGASLNRVGNSFRTVIRNVGLLTAAVTGAVAGFVAFVKIGTEAADAAGKSAQSLGLTIEQYSGLKFAIEQSGGTAEIFATAMNQLNRVLGANRDELAETARNGFGALENRAAELGITVRRGGEAVSDTAQEAINASTAFTKLGIRVRDADGQLRSGNDILLDIADAFAKMPDGAEKSAIALAILGRSGAEMIPFLNQGSAEIARLIGIGDRLGVVFTEAGFAISEKFNDALDRTKTAVAGLAGQIGLVFAPALTEIADEITDLIVANSTALREFASEVAARVIPVIRDFVAVLTGGDAVDNPWVAEWVTAIREFAVSAQSAVNDIIIPAFQALLAVFDTVAAGINAVFGTDIDGQALLIATAVLSLLGVFNLVGAAIGAVVSGIGLLISTFSFLGIKMSVVSGFFSLLVEGAVLFGSAIVGLVGWPALIVAGIVAAGVAVFLFWDEISAAALAAWNIITGLFSASGLSGLWDGLAGGAVAAWQAIASGAVAAWGGIVSDISGALGALGGLFTAYIEAQRVGWSLVGEQAAQAFSGLVTAATAAFDALVAGAVALWPRIEPAFTTIANGIGTAFDFILPLVQGVWDGITNIFTAGAATIAGIWQGISDTVSGLWTATSEAISVSAQAIVDAIGAANEAAGDVEGAAQIAAALVAPFQEAQAQIVAIWAEITALVETGFNAPVQAAEQAAASLGQVAQEITARLRRELESLIATLNSAMNRIVAAIDRAITRLRRAAAEARSAGGGGDGGEGFAFGGMIRGAGTSRSDSIPIWASNGEFMVQARAVRKYGVQFLRALNSGRLSLANLKGAFAGYADGGLIGSVNMEGVLDSLAALLGSGTMQPRLAVSGGGVQSQRALRPINLNLPSGESFEMLAPENVARKVMQFATGAAVRSAGRRPGWYK